MFAPARDMGLAEVALHREDRQVNFEQMRMRLYLSKKQKKGVIEGDKLFWELAKKRVLNDDVLDFLLANPHLIPEKWNDRYVFFWGTIYHCKEGGLGVRCLYNKEDRYFPLGSEWDAECPAALRY